METDVTRFVADTRPLRRYCEAFAIGFFLLALAAVAINWVRAGQLVLTRDLFIVLAIGPLGGVVLFGFIGTIARAYPVDVSPEGIVVRNSIGRRRLVRWIEIEAVHPLSLYGIPYLVLRMEGRLSPPSIPLWVKDRPLLQRTIERYAGESHVLSIALREAT
jgi:hypothetical protein